MDVTDLLLGDRIQVTIHNEMEHNGTSIHWHGLRQLNSNIQDGVNGITECESISLGVQVKGIRLH